MHIPFKQGKALTGTARYTSLGTHLGLEQSRRDDLEAILYVILYLVKGSLPWQGVVNKSKEEKYQAIMELKRDITPEELCSGLPIEFEDMMKYVKALKFTSRPDYGYLKLMLDNIFYRAGFVDIEFDWKIKHIKGRTQNVINHEADFLKTEAKERRKNWKGPVGDGQRLGEKAFKDALKVNDKVATQKDLDVQKNMRKKELEESSVGDDNYSKRNDD